MSGGDAKFFTSHKRGEVAEWREEINSTDKDVQKNAIKRIIANMSIGKDVSMLFPDVVNRAQTNDVELKKLVYLYLLNYARSQPELTILAVNTFVKDSADPNPLIRALAVRTMGCIRVEKITEYLCDPLQRTLTDEDPYVRKTAAICVAKLHDINPELVEDRGFIDQLRELLADSNPMVVANAVASLTEIQDASSSKGSIFQLDANNVYKLLAALNECTEWGQVFILDSLASYVARDESDASSVVERVAPRLQHANCAVVLSAVKVIVSQMSRIQNPETTRKLVKKLAPPLVTLLSAEAEIQYVALRNINLIAQKYPEMLTGEIKVFFCKYNDPIYVKHEKLETMVKLSSEQNIDQVLLEFKEYATEVDVDFVRKSVRAIGRCAISIEAAAERCIGILLELIATKVNYVVQEAIVVIKDIFRRYPNQYEGVIGVLCDSLDTLDEPEAKASMVWIIGEYAERIDNAEELLEAFLDTFLEEAPEVQLQLLTATVKLFLKKPSGGPQALIQTVLNQATSETDDPDLRDRAYIYWRLLSSDPEAAKDVVLATKPTIRDDRNALDPDLLQELLRQISTLSSVYHKLPSTFVPAARRRDAADGEDDIGGGTVDRDTGNADALDVMRRQQSAPAPAPSGIDLLADLMGGSSVAPLTSAGTNVMDAFDTMGGTATPEAVTLPQNILLTAEKGQGLQISGAVVPGSARDASPNAPSYDLTFSNFSQQPLDGFQLQFNKNAFALAPTAQPNAVITPNDPVMPGQSKRIRLPLGFSGVSSGANASATLQVAVKSPRQNDAVFYFADAVPLESVLVPDRAQGTSEAFAQQWQSSQEHSQQITLASGPFPLDGNADRIVDRLRARRWNLVSKQQTPGTRFASLYLSGTTPGPEGEKTILLSLTFAPGSQEVKVTVRTNVQGLPEMVFASMQRSLA